MIIKKEDYIWSYIGTILNVSVSALMLPFVLVYLSGDELGLWYVFATVGTLISLLDFGFTPTISRNIAYTWSGAKKLNASSMEGIEIGDGVNASLFLTVLKTCRLIYSIIAIVSLLLMLAPGTLYMWSIAHNSDCSFWLESWIVYLSAIFLNLFFSYYASYLRGIGAVAENAKATVISKLFLLFLTIILLMLGFGLLGTSIGYLVSVFVFRVLSKVYFEKDEAIQDLLAKRLRIPFEEVKEMFATIWHNAWRDGLVTLSTFLSTQINTLICSAVLGLTSTGFYGLALQISSVIMTVAAIWYTTIQPKLQECAIKRELATFTSMFAQAVVIYCVISVPLVILITCFCNPIISWLRPGMDFDIPIYLVVCLYIFVFRGNSMCISAISNFNTIPYTRAYIITGIASTVASYALAALTNMGLWSLVFPPLLLFLAYNAWKWPTVILRLLDVRASSFIKMGLESIRATIGKI